MSYNFSALTCESCRTFFRRNANRTERLCHSKREMEMIAKYSQITDNGNTNTQVSTDSPATTAMCLHQKDGTDKSADNQMPAYIRGLIFTFNDTERHRLKQLFYSTTWLRDPVVNLVVEPSTEPEVLRVLQMRTEMHCRRIIKMSKTINEFRELCESDKITLLKSGSQEIITLLNILSFNFEGEFWTVYTGSEYASILHLDFKGRHSCIYFNGVE
ncbi:unnamed protein product [Medioppia subpectinata]|uniref:NR LBD domain-containing protein n=1 Tax=Medioppia subpectinata TaxID=1979941 RepID=A0A7R9L3T0_9ACAR|nr:unnamed protein product [Medioppia subpectinata]CAG2113793.1 unnamed protein product [Medioppia subpectinata]